MKNKFFVFCTLILIKCFSLQGVDVDPLLVNSKDNKIIVHNRILTKINGKAISTYDLMRKMDIIFYRQFPQFLNSIPARYQFYQINWKSILEELVDKEVILADAKEHKIEVSSGEVRQEMEQLFGPNMIANLDKAGMTFEEAAKIVQGDLIIRQLINYRVNAKTLRIVTPIKVRKAYEDFIQDSKNARLTQWNYQVITVRDRNAKKTEETADKAYRLLIEQGVPLEQLIEKLKEQKVLGRKAKVTLSEEIVNNEQELSDNYKTILSSMEPGMISQPSAHKSRADNTTVYRIFYLKDKKPGGMPTFKEMENNLKEKLLNEAADQETDNYLNKLRQHYRVTAKDIHDMISPDYQPFELK